MPPVAAQLPPSTGPVDLARLFGRIVLAATRAPLDFSFDAVFRAWAARTAARLADKNLIVNLGVKKVLLVGSRELSQHVLAQLPSRSGFSAGSLKRSAMAFLAARALTISDDDDWRRRRAFNEWVLEPDRAHELAREFVRHALEAFTAPVASVEDLRSAMGRTMLAVVFGGDAPPDLVDEIQKLFDLVQKPLKRILTAPRAHRLRENLYDALRVQWEAQSPAASPSLLRMAYRSTTQLDGAELLEQIPHWMFTFTGSGTDLLTRTLALISSAPDVRVRVLAEVQAAGSLDGGCNFSALPLLEACLIEAAHLYPPVTRTFHHVFEETTVGSVRIPRDMEIMHLFPLFASDGVDGGADSRHFNPDRWLRGEPPSCSFDPFLGGARRCPGRSLILLVCKAGLASLLVRHRLMLDAPQLISPLPAEFPRRALRFRCVQEPEP